MEHWAPSGWIFEILGGFWGTSNIFRFYKFSIDPKISNNFQKNQKWGESDAKGGASAQLASESGPGEGLLGLPSWPPAR
jgi:hypothetical protein